eukprot:962914-Rhodomonas_salina.1
MINVMLSTLTEERRAFAEEHSSESEARREERRRDRCDDEARDQRHCMLSTSNTMRILRAPAALDGSSTISDSISDSVSRLKTYLACIKLEKSDWVVAAQ